MDKPITPDKDVMELTARARDSWQSLRRGESWEHWITVGQAIDAYRRQLYRVLQINEPKGQNYKTAMAGYLRENGWLRAKDTRDGARPRYSGEGIDDGARANLQHCIDHYPEIEAFRQTLPLNNLVRQNHPNTVWRAFKKWKIPPKDKNSDRETPTSKLRESIRELSEENDRLNRKVAGDDDWEEQVRTLVTTTDTEQLADAILNELDGQTDKPNDDAKVIPLAPIETALTAVNLKLERTPTGDYRIRPLPAGKTVPTPKPIEVPNLKGLPRGERRAAMLKALDLAVHPNTTTDEALASLRGYFQMAEGSLPTEIWGSPKPGPDVITADDEGSVDDRIEDTITSLHDTMQKWHDYVADLNSQLEDSEQELAKVKVERDAALARVKEMELQSQ
jgi:hypothetical protein